MVCTLHSGVTSQVKIKQSSIFISYIILRIYVTSNALRYERLCSANQTYYVLIIFHVILFSVLNYSQLSNFAK